MRLITRSPSRLALVAGVLAAMSLYAYAFARETPFGALRGRVLAADTQRPLAGAELLIRSEIPRDGRSLWPVRADEEGFFEIRRLPAGGYDVQTATSVYQSRHQFAEVLEGKTTAVELRLPPGDPFLNLHVHQRAYLPEEEPRMALHGFRQGDALRLRLLAVDSATLVRDYGSDLRSMLTPVAATVPQGSLRVQRSRHLLPVREWTYSIRKKDAEGVFYEHVRLGRLRPGLYLIAARGATNEALGWLMVTDLALVTKTDDGRLLAFATDLRTGKPVPSARLTVYRGATTVAQTSTDARGLADISLGTDSNEDDIAAVAQHGSSVAFMRFYHYDAGARQ
ncbi:MAG: carboxypeptidase regulatory-like domain-containing protein, partial [Armatimonadetes bacterium]|nr:carboxypeptidase regulatory-like domain-containing protein [Armatimonadota bacterium]